MKNSRSEKLIYTTREVIKMDSVFSKVSDLEIASFTQSRNLSWCLRENLGKIPV